MLRGKCDLLVLVETKWRPGEHSELVGGPGDDDRYSVPHGVSD